MAAENIVVTIPFGEREITLSRGEKEGFTPKAWEALCRWIRVAHPNSLYAGLRSEGFAFDDMIHEFAAGRARWDGEAFTRIVERVVANGTFLGHEDEEVQRLTSYAAFGVHLLKTKELRHDPNSSLYGPPVR